MKKLLTLLALASLLPAALPAATITPEEALLRARRSNRLSAVTGNLQTPRLVHTEKWNGSLPTVYVFDSGDGYLLLGADDVAAPLLGYSDSGKFDLSNLPPQMKWWLEEYSRQIAAASAASSGSVALAPATQAAEDMEEIAPLLKTQWNQDAPYNDDAPVFEGRASMTGCVATSMAQVMNYFRYPAIGTGKITYTTETYRKELSMDLGENGFDWSAMQDTYVPGSHENGEAVAYLMKCCGYSVFMNYTPDESSAMSYQIAPALINNFQYDKGIWYTHRNLYSTEEWNRLIYDNLKNVGPVIYNGTSSLIGGHSFVCDGYDGAGFFHINWGWGGLSDGYFIFDALNPSAIGIGGGSGGFNFSQAAVLGIQPPVSDSEVHPYNLTQQGTLDASVSGSTLIFTLTGTSPAYWMNKNAIDFKYSMGAQFEPIDGTAGETFTNICYLVGSNTNGSLAPNFYYNDLRPSTSIEGLTDGRYKVTMTSRDNSVSGAPWIPVLCDYRYNNYIYLTKKGEDISIEVPQMRTLELKSVTVDTDLYYGCLANISFTVENPTDVELTQGYAPLVIYGGRSMLVGESVVLTVPARETVTATISTPFYSLSSSLPPNNSKVYIRLYDPQNGMEAIYREPHAEVVIKKNPGLPTMSLTSIKVDEEKDSEGVYELDLQSTLDFTADFKVLRGYFAYPLYAAIQDAEGTTLLQQKIEDSLILKAGETSTATVSMEYPEAVAGTLYTARLCYMMDYELRNIGTGFEFRYRDGAGVSEVVEAVSSAIRYDAGNALVSVAGISDVESISLYDLAGRRVAFSKGNTLSVEGITSGIWHAVARLSDGSLVSSRIVIR